MWGGPVATVILGLVASVLPLASPGFCAAAEAQPPPPAERRRQPSVERHPPPERLAIRNQTPNRPEVELQVVLHLPSGPGPSRS